MHSRNHSVGSHHGSKKLEIQHEVSPKRHQKREREGIFLHGEIRKLKPTTFDGVKLGEVVKTWLVEMNKCLYLHENSDNEKAIITNF